MYHDLQFKTAVSEKPNTSIVCSALFTKMHSLRLEYDGFLAVGPAGGLFAWYLW